MPSHVPQQRTEPAYSEIQIGRAVRAREWRDLGHLYHWLRGSGMQLIPAHTPKLLLETDAGGDLYYRMHPSATAIARVWVLVMRASAGGTAVSTVDVTYPDSVTRRWSVRGAGLVNGPGPAAQVYVETLAAKSGSLTELVLGLNVPSGSGDAYVESVACWELTRQQLTIGDTDDLGIEIETLRSGQPIYDDGAGDQRSVAALAAHLALETTAPRRVLHAHAFGYTAITSGTLTDLYALPVPLVPRKIRRTDTTAALWVAIYAYVTDGSTEGYIAIETPSGGQIEIDVTSTTPTWLGTELGSGTLSALCEDLSTADGAPSGGIDTMAVKVQRTAGSGALVIESVMVWEGPPAP